MGEGAGVGWMKGVDSMAMPEGSTLFDLVQTGLSHTHAAVGVVVRLRKELSLVKDIPVLIAVDQVRHVSRSPPVIISSALWTILSSRALSCISIVCSDLFYFSVLLLFSSIIAGLHLVNMKRR